MFKNQDSGFLIHPSQINEELSQTDEVVYYRWVSNTIIIRKIAKRGVLSADPTRKRGVIGAGQVKRVLFTAAHSYYWTYM